MTASIDFAASAASVAALVGPGPLEVARERAKAAGVEFGRDMVAANPGERHRAVFLVFMDGVTLFVRSQELEALHAATTVAERGHAARFEVNLLF